jgi:uncharacterized protein
VAGNRVAEMIRPTATARSRSSQITGSRARGAVRPDSDYDVAVFIRGFDDRWHEVDRIVPVVTDIIDDTGAVIHAMPYCAGAYDERTSLMREIRREGVDL